MSNLAASVQDIHAWTAKDNKEVHSVDSNAGIVPRNKLSIRFIRYKVIYSVSWPLNIYTIFSVNELVLLGLKPDGIAPLQKEAFIHFRKLPDRGCRIYNDGSGTNLLDSKINMFLDSKAEVTIVREILLSQLVLLNLEATLQDLLGLHKLYIQIFIQSKIDSNDNVKHQLLKFVIIKFAFSGERWLRNHHFKFNNNIRMPNPP